MDLESLNLLTQIKLLIFYIVLIMCVVSSDGTKCSKRDDCYKSGSSKVKCGICVTNDTLGQNICLYPFSDVYEVPYCNVREDHCMRQPCREWSIGEPVDTAEGCVCKCSKGYYGTTCEEKGDKSRVYPSGIQLVAASEVENRRPLVVLAVVDVDGDGFSLRFSSATGLLSERFTRPTLRLYSSDEASTKKCRSVTGNTKVCDYMKNSQAAVYKTTVSFPFKSFQSHGHLVLHRDNRVVGYVAQLNLDVFSFQLRVASLKRNVYVHYDAKISCVPDVEILNCAKTLESRNRYSVVQTIQLDSRVEYQRAGGELKPHQDQYPCDEASFYQWMAWPVQDNKDYEGTPATQFFIGKASWKIKPFDFPPGVYLVKLNAFRKFNAVNFDKCYLELVPSQLLAVIYGGSERYVNTEDGMVWDASQSRDPNQSKEKSFTALEFTWSCNRTWEALCQPQVIKGEKYHSLVIKPNVLVVDQVYDVTLMVRSPESNSAPAFAHQLIHVGSASDSEGMDACQAKDLEVVCIYNCKERANPQDVISLRANAKGGWRSLRSCVFNWTVLEDGVKPLEGSYWQQDTPNFILIIKEDILQHSKSYSFKIKVFKGKVFAVYTVGTTNPTTMSCEINPSAGVAGVTLFNISCLSQLSRGLSLTYEFYDKGKDDKATLSGRMLGSQQTSTLAGVLLTRGTVVIYQYDEYGSSRHTFHNVELSKNTTIDVSYIRRKMKVLSDISDYSAGVTDTLRAVSFIIEVLEPEMKLDNIYEDLLSVMSKIPLDSLVGVKMCTSTLHNILMTAHKLHNPTLSVAATAHASQTLASITAAWHSAVDQTLTFSEMYELISYLLSCVDVILGHTNEEMMSKPEEYVSPDIYDYVTVGSKKLLESVDTIAHILLHRHLPGQLHKQIVSGLGNTSVWIKVDLPKRISSYIMRGDYYNFTVKIPYELTGPLDRKDVFLGLQLTILKEQPLWWLKDVRTNNKAVYLCYKRDDQVCRYPRQLTSDFLVKFNTSHLVSQVQPFNGTVTQLDPQNSQDVDLDLTVLRLDPPNRAKTSVKFLFGPNDKELRVLISKNRRPDYEMMMKSGQLVSARTPYFELLYDSRDSYHFYYIAILPADDTVPVNTSVNFTVRIYYELCKTWTKAAWDTYGCNVGVSAREGSLRCHCSHLSLFAGQIDTPTSVLSPLQPSTLLLTLSDSPLVLISVLLLMFGCILCFILAHFKDGKDKLKRLTIVMEDNFPGEHYPYLLCVVTGTRVRAGTNANVGIKLYGSKGQSRPHILKCKQRRVLQVMGEDWFLLYSPVSLGQLRSLYIWHDNKGIGPAWYCDRIVIYDLTHKTTNHFLVRGWLALNLHMSPEAMAVAAPPSVVLGVQQVFLDQTRIGFRLSHLWLGVLVRHPRDPVTRVDRLCISLCFLLVSLASSLGLFLLSDSNCCRHPRDPVTRVDRLAISLCFLLVSLVSSLGLFLLSDSNTEEDSPSYSLSGRDIEMSVYSFLLAAVTANLLMILFSKTYSIEFHRDRPSTRRGTGQSMSSRHSSFFQRHEEAPRGVIQPIPSFRINPNAPLPFGSRKTIWEVTQTPQMGSETFNCWRWLEMKLCRLLMFRPLAPLQLPEDESNIYVDHGWLTLSWLVCGVTVVSCCVACVLLAQGMAPVHSLQWFTVALLSVILHAFVYLPLKLILRAACLSLFFKRLIYTDVFTFNPEDGQQKELKGDPEHTMNLLALRSQPMYLPVIEQVRQEGRLLRMRAYRWNKVFELLLISVFMVVLSGMLCWDTLHFHTNSHVRSVLASSHKPSSPSFFNVFNRTDFEKYLETTLVENVYKFVWYNLLPLNEEGVSFRRKDWLFDNTLRMLGRIRIRQFRVQPDYCRVPARLRSQSTCAGPWRWAAQDTRDYYSAWQNQTFLDGRDTRRWLFTGPRSDQDFWNYGRTGNVYPPGGYKLDLGTTRTETQVMVETLVEDWWAGHYTRAVIVQLTVYNPNTRWLTEAVLVAEQTVAGQYITTAMAHSVNLEMHLSLSIIAFFLLVCLMLVRMLAMMNQHGLLGYFARFRRPYELFLLVLALASLVYWTMYYLTAPPYIQQYQSTGEDNDFNFFKVAYYSLSGRALLCTLFIFGGFRFFALWRFGRVFFRFFYTFMLSRHIILYLTIVFLFLLMILWRFIAYYLNSFVDTVFNPNLFFRTNYSYLSDNSQSTPYRLVSFFICYLSVILIAFLVSVFVFEYKVAKSFNVKDWNQLNLVVFVVQEVVAYYNKINTHKIKPSSTSKNNVIH